MVRIAGVPKQNNIRSKRKVATTYRRFNSFFRRR